MLKPVYALVGGDLFLHLQGVKDIAAQAPADHQRADFDGETASAAEVIDELRSFAMFSTTKLVVVRNADDLITRFRDALENYVAKPAAHSVLVLRCGSLPSNQRIYKLIAASGRIIDCNPPRDLPRWIMDRARTAHNMQIGDVEARLLAEMIGSDLGRLDNELARLALQYDGKPQAADISRSVVFQREQEMWEMTNEVHAGNVAAALKRWRQLLDADPSAEFRAFTWLTMWLEKARRAMVMRGRGRSDNDIAAELKIWPASRRPDFFRTVNALGEQNIARLIALLAELDLRSKSGLGTMADNVTSFLLTLARTQAQTAPV